MTSVTQLPNEPDRHADEDPGGPPTDISKPIGDAIPTPVEPGLDQPLPPKGESLEQTPATPAKGHRTDKDEDGGPLGETDPPGGVPSPGPSDFA